MSTMETLYCVKLIRLQLLKLEDEKQIHLDVVFTEIFANALETKTLIYEIKSAMRGQ